MSGWYSKFTPDGRRLLSGEVIILDHGEPVLLRDGRIRGSNPCPLNNREFVWNPGDRRGARTFDFWTGTDLEVYPRELSELAAGGGVIAGRDAERGELVIIRPGQPVEIIAGAGQPSVAADGEVVYRVGDDKIEPFICRTAVAWGDGHGRILAHRRGSSDVQDVTVGNWEARAFLFDGPDDEPWTLCMGPGGSLRCRPLFGVDGYLAPPAKTGDNRNILAHAVCLEGRVLAVWQSTSGEQITHKFDLALRPEDLTLVAVPSPAPAPSPVPPSPEVLIVSTPNHHAVVEEVNRKFPHLLVANTEETVGEFTERSVLALSAVDRNWGHVGKQPGEKQWNGHAVDAAKYRTTGQVIDFVIGAGSGNPTTTTWIEQPSREGNDWTPPIPVGERPAQGPTPAPGPAPPAPAPPSSGHAYERDDDERDECDRIMPDGSQCDQPRAAAIHAGVSPQPPAPPPPPAPGPTPPPRSDVASILSRLSGIGMDVLAVQALIRGLPPTQLPEPHVCPPSPPCDLPHGTAPTGPPMSEPELQAFVAELAKAHAGGTRRIMPPAELTFLLFGFLWEGVSRERTLERARERAQS